MATSIVTYFDYKSPYAFVANKLVQELSKDWDVVISWKPYTLHIPDFLGSAEINERGERIIDARTDHQWRRVKYIYMDCRRLAAQRGLTLRAPRKVFSSFVAHVGALYALKHGAFLPYHNAVFETFWRRELDLDSINEISALLKLVGVNRMDFEAFVAGDGKREHDRIMEEAHTLGVFGVPSFVIDSELYWGGDHLPMLRERLALRCGGNSAHRSG
jgi:2-hydroxychromene-2-carboxylate isomerase